MKKHIPNIITCCNLICGCLATGAAFHHHFSSAFLFILLGALFDFFDGMTARALGVSGKMGVELDSLADVVASGVAPGFIMFWLMSHSADLPQVVWLGVPVLPCLAFLLPVFSAIRLAKFNVDDTQKTSFRGLPAPGMAIFVASLPLALSQMGHLADGVLGYWACLGITLFFSFLMVSRLRFFSFKMNYIFMNRIFTFINKFNIFRYSTFIHKFITLSIFFITIIS